MLQPKPRSGEGCNTLSHEGLANIDMEKNALSSVLCTYLSSTLGLNGNEAPCCRVLMGMKPVASDWSMRHIEMYNCQQLKRQVSILNTN